jgi:hypothetical protein
MEGKCPTCRVIVSINLNPNFDQIIDPDNICCICLSTITIRENTFRSCKCTSLVHKECLTTYWKNNRNSGRSEKLRLMRTDEHRQQLHEPPYEGLRLQLDESYYELHYEDRRLHEEYRRRIHEEQRRRREDRIQLRESHHELHNEEHRQQNIVSNNTHILDHHNHRSQQQLFIHRNESYNSLEYHPELLLQHHQRHRRELRQLTAAIARAYTRD